MNQLKLTLNTAFKIYNTYDATLGDVILGKVQAAGKPMGGGYFAMWEGGDVRWPWRKTKEAAAQVLLERHNAQSL